jgi:hypothetical protein
MTRIGPALLATLLATGPAPAQLAPGDYVAPVPTVTGTQVLGIAPGGAVKTIFSLPFTVSALTMAADNVDLAVVGAVSSSPFVALITPSGAVTTLAMLPFSPSFENLAVDQDGTYLTPPMGLSGAWIFRVDGTGRLTTILPNPKVGGGKTRGIAVDIGSGDYLVGDSSNLFRIAHDGTATLASKSISIPNETDMVSDARTGALVSWLIDLSSFPSKYSLVAIDPVSGAATTIRRGFPSNAPGLAYDRTGDAFLIAGPASANVLWRVDRRGTLTTVAPLAGARDLETYGLRNVLAAADPSPGATFQLTFSEPASPNLLYLAAASFASRPGIPTPAGTIDLAPDALFFLSLQAPAFFANFQGRLDVRGTSIASIPIPPGPLKGLRFYVSFVTVQGSAIHAVANTQGFTVR